eukprot:3850024-Amphidinium_carterae.1
MRHLGSTRFREANWVLSPGFIALPQGYKILSYCKLVAWSKAGYLKLKPAMVHSQVKAAIRKGTK